MAFRKRKNGGLSTGTTTQAPCCCPSLPPATSSRQWFTILPGHSTRRRCRRLPTCTAPMAAGTGTAGGPRSPASSPWPARRDIEGLRRRAAPSASRARRRPRPSCQARSAQRQRLRRHYCAVETADVTGQAPRAGQPARLRARLLTAAAQPAGVASQAASSVQSFFGQVGAAIQGALGQQGQAAALSAQANQAWPTLVAGAPSALQGAMHGGEIGFFSAPPLVL